MTRRPTVQECRKRFAGRCFFALTGRCAETDYVALQAHRIVPGEAGGTYHWDNVLPLCASCHARVTAGTVAVHARHAGTGGAYIRWTDEAGATHFTPEDPVRHRLAAPPASPAPAPPLPPPPPGG